MLQWGGEEGDAHTGQQGDCGRQKGLCVAAELCLSLFGVPGSWCTQGLFEPSERLWWEWGLSLKHEFAPPTNLFQINL